jgi:predicted DNA binding CopG/RHH family protein
VRRASAEREKELDENLGLQTISIRLQKGLLANLKRLAKHDGIGYQPYIRQILMRHVRYEAEERKEKVKHQRKIMDAS